MKFPSRLLLLVSFAVPFLWALSCNKKDAISPITKNVTPATVHVVPESVALKVGELFNADIFNVLRYLIIQNLFDY